MAMVASPTWRTWNPDTPTTARPRKSAMVNLHSSDASDRGGLKRKATGFARFLRKRTVLRKVLVGSRKARSVVLLNLLAAVYASNIPVIKETEAATDPALFNMVRFMISVVPFVPSMLHAQGDCQTIVNGLELGCWISLGYFAEALGLLTSDAARASFLSQFMVIVVPLLDGFLGGTVPAFTWQGAIISLVGVGLLESSGSPPCVGDLLSLLSAVFFGIHMLRTEHISRSTKKENVFVLLGYQVCVVAFFATLWYLFRGELGEVDQASSSWQWSIIWDWVVTFPWIAALYTGVFSSSVCLWAEMHAMSDVSATETAIIYGLEPVWGATFAWFLLGERWDIIGWMGAVLVLGGSLAVQIFGSAHEISQKQSDCSSHLDHMNSKKSTELTLSTIAVRSTKEPQLLPKKRDRL